MNSRVILGAVDEAVVDSRLLVAGCGLAGCSQERATLKGASAYMNLRRGMVGGVDQSRDCRAGVSKVSGGGTWKSGECALTKDPRRAFLTF